MTNTERQKMKALKHEISHPKRELLRVVAEMEAMSPRQAEQLAKIVARLEDFQNR
jgi:molecular chaperone GrpE (heat shock protein)